MLLWRGVGIACSPVIWKRIWNRKQSMEEEMGRSKTAPVHKQIEGKAGEIMQEGDKRAMGGGNSCRQRLLLTFLSPSSSTWLPDKFTESEKEREVVRGERERERNEKINYSGKIWRWATHGFKSKREFTTHSTNLSPCLFFGACVHFFFGTFPPYYFSPSPSTPIPLIYPTFAL